MGFVLGDPACSQVFLSRSAAADKARQEAVASVGRMRTFMQQLMQQCPQLDVSALQAVSTDYGIVCKKMLTGD
jgi:hypothetical protein